MIGPTLIHVLPMFKKALSERNKPLWDEYVRPEQLEQNKNNSLHWYEMQAKQTVALL